MSRFAVVGAGWRAAYFWRAAEQLSDIECVGAVVRSPRPLPVPAFESLEECLSVTRPDFVITAVPWSASPRLIRELVERGMAVLAETPPAPDRDGLFALWADVGASGLVQVAEQYLLMPSHAARLALARTGAIGRVTSVQVSSTHQYHAVSLMRGFLGAGLTPVTARATSFTADLLDPLAKNGWTDATDPTPATTVLATLDFGDGRSGLYDFTDNQWHNQLRFRRILVRGSLGELRDDEVVRLPEPRTFLRSALVRRQTGYDLDLDGFETEHITLGDHVLYRNPYPGRRWSDEEIAIATLLEATARWAAGDGPAPYPLAEASHDHLIALAVAESAEQDGRVTTPTPPWASAREQ
ncbi:MAG: Gfo/Idh/MocA family oxidoreductase [bacterium]